MTKKDQLKIESLQCDLRFINETLDDKIEELNEIKNEYEHYKKSTEIEIKNNYIPKNKLYNMLARLGKQEANEYNDLMTTFINILLEL